MSSSKATATAATAAAATPLSVKVSADGQIRRFTIPSEGTAALRFAALQKVLRENYADKLKAGATLKFADDEGDYCVLSSAAEFAEAVRLLGNPPATLKLFLTANASATPVTVTATTPVAAPAPAPASPAKIYPALPAKPVVAAVATPVKAAAAAPAAGPAPKVEAAPKPAVAAKASPVPAAKPVAVAPTATATDAKASPKSTDSKDAKSADAKAEATPEEQVREKRRAFRTALRAALADEKVRAALKELVPAGIQAVEALANGSDKRSLSAVLTALVASSTVLSANEFIAKQALPRAVAKLDAVEQLVRPFLPTVVPFLPLAAVHLPEQIDRLAERLEQREKFAEQWRAAKAAGACGKGTDCPKKGQFGKMFGFGGPFMRGGCGPFGLLRGLFRGCAEQNTTGADGAAAAEENGCGAFPKELKDLFRALRGHGPFVPRHGHQGHGHHGHGHGFGHGHWRRHCGGRSRSRDNKENTTAAAGDASAAAAAEKTADGKVIHYRVTCDGCGADPLVGVRFKCTQCRNFDLCEACEATNKHPADHALMKIRVSRWNADGRRRRSPSRDATPSGPVVHTNIECDGCNASPIVGVRFKCTQCPDFDLCGTCEEAGKHSEHTLLKMKTADSAPAHGRRHGHGHGGCHRPGAGMGMGFGSFGPFAGPFGGPHRHGHGHHHAHGPHPFGPHPFGPRGPWGRRGRGCGGKAASSSSGSSGSDSESDAARATAAQVAELVAANPFLASAIEGVEVRRAAPDAADPNTASIPVDVTAGPQALLAALLPTVFTKHNAAKATAAPATKKPEASASATTASAPTAAAAAAAAPAKDEKGAAVKPVAAPTATAAAPKAAAATASKFDADVEQLKSMGFSGHSDATLRQLLAVAEAKKHRRFHSNVAWVVDALLSGAADKYL